MSPVEEVSVMEMEVAEALLELQHDKRETHRGSQSQIRTAQPEITAEMESSTYGSLSVRPSSETQFKVTSGDSRQLSSSRLGSPKVARPGVDGGCSIRNNKTLSQKRDHYRHLGPIKTRLNLYRKYQEEQRCWSKLYQAKVSNGVKKTKDMATQTDNEYKLPKVQKMETFIKELCGTIVCLKNQLESCKKSSLDKSKQQEDEVPESLNEASHSAVRRAIKRKYCNTLSSMDENKETDNKIEKEEKHCNMGLLDDDNSSSGDEEYSRLHERNGSTSEMVPIGDGNATVPSRVLKQLDWSSYTNATRKLLTAVFSRKILATHSLTGKPSPAFPDKPAKKKLNQAIVNDIVHTVMERCKVPENIVRTIITTKCADESKMFRNRQQNKKRRLSKKENASPRSSSSEESTN